MSFINATEIEDAIKLFTYNKSNTQRKGAISKQRIEFRNSQLTYVKIRPMKSKNGDIYGPKLTPVLLMAWSRDAQKFLYLQSCNRKQKQWVRFCLMDYYSSYYSLLCNS